MDTNTTSGPDGPSASHSEEHHFLVADSSFEATASHVTEPTATNETIGPLERPLPDGRKEVNGQEVDLSDPIIDRFPPEISAEIFQIYAESGIGPASPRDIRLWSPIPLTEVCHTWTDFVKSVPSLWKCIRIFLDKATCDMNLRVLEEHIQNSRQVALTLELRMGGDYDDETVKKYFDIFSGCSGRWEVLDVELLGGLWNHFANQFNTDDSCLRALRLRSPRPDILLSSDPHGQGPLPHKARPTAVDLTRVSVRYVDIDWGSVKKIIAREIGMHAVLALFNHAVKMTDLTLRVLGQWSICYDLPPDGQTWRSMITSLDIQFDRDDDARSFFLGTILPTLTRFVYNMEGATAPVPIFKDFIARSGDTLRAMSLTMVDFSAHNDLVGLLRTTRRLQKLVLSTHPTNSSSAPCNNLLLHLLETRIAESPEGDFMNALEHLEIEAWDIVWGTVEDLCLFTYEGGSRLLSSIRIVDIRTNDAPRPFIDREKWSIISQRQMQGLAIDFKIKSALYPADLLSGW